MFDEATLRGSWRLVGVAWTGYFEVVDIVTPVGTEKVIAADAQSLTVNLN